MDLRSQFYVPEKVVTLPLNSSGKRFALPDVPLDNKYNKSKARHRGEIVKHSKSWIDMQWVVIIMKQNTNGDEAIADFLAQEYRADGEREYVEVAERNRVNKVVCISHGGDRPNHKYQREPRRPTRGRIPAEEREWRNLFAKSAQLRRRRFSNSALYEVAN